MELWLRGTGASLAEPLGHSAEGLSLASPQLAGRAAARHLAGWGSERCRLVGLRLSGAAVGLAARSAALALPGPRREERITAALTEVPAAAG